MQKNYNEWMSESLRELTPASRIKRPSYETVVNWVNRSWNTGFAFG
ncbi:19616_t:CDS:1 [Funneliformis geosporum]|uniref:19616_t:CDS:1 n=1 Tax=Funneliformis geosporum TaxID=1117311 RepID=A0A9W4WYP1_9GLOM|nr:19616_t:CDS:1 [Funneliformis geosporum]